MNQPIHPPFMPPQVGPTPQDLIRVQAFASAGEINFYHLNRTLGLSLSTLQYRHLQQYFFREASQNPTLGELKLLGHLISRTPPADRIAPGELYTDSTELMDTWADVMACSEALQIDSPELCPLSRVLSLPQAYLTRRKQLDPAAPVSRVVSEGGKAAALSQGYKPLVSLRAPAGAPREIWVKARNPASAQYDHTPELNDLLIALPPSDISALGTFLYEHPAAGAVKAVAAATNTSFLQAAVALCRGWGLAINLESLLATDQGPVDSPIQAYLERWETDAPAGSAYAILRVSPILPEKVITSLEEHGFAPCVLGVVTKSPYLVMSYRQVPLVTLKASFAQAPAPILPYRCLLAPPAPIGEALPKEFALSPLHSLEEASCVVADCTLRIEGADSEGLTNGDGSSPAMQGLLSLCCEFATAGITYDRIKVSPVLYCDCAPEAPLLLSAVCGLYRAAAELGILLVSPEILFKKGPRTEGADALVLSLVAYSHETPKPTPALPARSDQPLGFLALDREPLWEDVRGLLFHIASAVSENTAAHYTHGQSVLSLLSRAASPDGTPTVGLFDSHEALLATPFPFGFLTEGSIPAGGVHVGVTYAPAPAAEGPAEPFKITPVSPISLTALKEKEMNRRKEIAAMKEIKAFESLSQKPRTVLLDTDIGPDCDDVGALAVLIYYAKQYGFPIGGICNCTSNKAGNGVIDAVCRRCGIDTPPLGQWSGVGFMDGAEHCKYNVAVAEAHSEAYRNGTLPVEDAVTYYRKRLAAEKDGNVMVISIGMFNNLAALLDSPADDISPLSGVELVKAKVYALVSMAAILPQGRECNVVSDYPAAQKVFADWPTAIYLSDFHIGVNVKTGYDHITDPAAIMADPLPMSYHLYTKEWNWEGAVKGQNASYDLTAVQFAALGIGELYDLDTPGDLEFYAEIPDLPDATRFIPNPMGNKIFMTKKVPDEAIAQSLQTILNSF